jgi:hypothetical protein
MKIEIHQNGSRKHFQYFSSKKVTVGSGSDADLVIPEEQKVGANLITIEEINGEIFVTDAGSESGVFIQGNALNLNEKTKLMTIFPLEIGIDLSLFISDENDPAVASPKLDESLMSNSSRSTRSTEPRQSSKSTSLPSRNKINPKVVEIKQPPKFHPSKDILVVVAIIILGGIGFAYYKIIHTQKAKITGAEATKLMGIQKVEVTPEPVPQLYDGLNFHLKRELFRMQNVFKGNLCSTELEIKLCKLLDLNFDYGEGVVIKDNVLYIFAPFYEMFNSKEKLLQINQEEMVVHQILMMDYVLSAKFKTVLDMANVPQMNLVSYKTSSKNDFYILNLFILNTQNFSTLDKKIKNDFLKRASEADDINSVLREFQTAFVNWNFGSQKQVQ